MPPDCETRGSIVPSRRCHPERIHEDARSKIPAPAGKDLNVHFDPGVHCKGRFPKQPCALIPPSPLPPTPPPLASSSSRSYSRSCPPFHTAAPAPPKSSANPPLPTCSLPSH